MAFFSVIVPTLNRVELLKSTVDSSLAQRYADFELIIVDDGSRDKTLECLRALGAKAIV
jgi:glycosyltransferase involved in cell wall biosynthesis